MGNNLCRPLLYYTQLIYISSSRTNAIWPEEISKPMKMLSCKDMGMDDDFVAKGMTEGEVMTKIMEHAKEAHSEKMAGMSDEEITKMKETMKMKTKDEM